MNCLLPIGAPATPKTNLTGLLTWLNLRVNSTTLGASFNLFFFVHPHEVSSSGVMALHKHIIPSLVLKTFFILKNEYRKKLILKTSLKAQNLLSQNLIFPQTKKATLKNNKNDDNSQRRLSAQCVKAVSGVVKKSLAKVRHAGKNKRMKKKKDSFGCIQMNKHNMLKSKIEG